MTGLEGKILDRYELRSLVGKGGMADVYLGFDPHFERDVAVKVFKREDDDLLRRFVREARLMASLHHEHLMPVYDTGAAMVEGVPRYYIVMPYLGGGTLRARIRRGPVPLREACRHLNEIAGALDYIHAQGIIHRDIKSSNVLLDDDRHCYLADFGIARSNTENTQMTSTGNVLGTVDYIAPELFETDRKADLRSDLYSLGVLLYEMVTGRLPFVGENQLAIVTMHITQPPPPPGNFVPAIPPSVERVVLRALEKRPEARYNSASALAEAFCNAVAGRATMQQPIIASAIWDEVGQRAESAARSTPLVLPPSPIASAAPRVRSTGAYPGVPAPQQTPRPGQYTPPRHTPRPTPERRRGKAVAIFAILTLLAVAVPMAYVAWQMPHNGTPPIPTVTGKTGTASPGSTVAATPNATATAQAAGATATARAKGATATVVVGATATVQARASATAGVAQTAIATKALYQDPLNNADRQGTVDEQWDQKSGKCTFQSDGYHVSGSSGFFGGFIGCHEAGQQYGDAAFVVDMSIVSGHSGGLFFRLATNSVGAYKGYLFEVDTQGNYKISSANNFSTGSGLNTIRDWTASSALKKGAGAKNRLLVIAHSNSLSFYANGSFLAPVVQDDTFTDGNVGFLATTDQDNPSADVVYSNIGIHQ